MNKNRYINIAMMIAGSFLYGAGICCFLNPASIAPGGVSGVCIILNHLFKLPIGVTSIILNLPILYMGYKRLTPKLIIRTVFALIFTSAIIDFIITPLLPVYSGDRLLGSLFGGVILGTGLGLIFTAGYTTGGTDIMSMLLRLKFPELRIGIAILIIDFFVISISAVFFKDIEALMYGVITLFFSGKVIDFLVYFGDSSRLAFIVTDKYEEVSSEIFKTIDRGTTIISGIGGYSGNDRKIIFCAVRHREFSALKNAVFTIDKNAFVTSIVSDGIFGEGFFRQKLF